MISVKIVTDQNSSKNVEVYIEKIEEFFEELLLKKYLWEIDYVNISSDEKYKCFGADLYYRCYRTICHRNLQVSFFGYTFNTIDELNKRKYWFFDTFDCTISPINQPHRETHIKINFSSRLSLIRDDETGVQIESKDFTEQRKIYEECIKEKKDYKITKLKDDKFLRFIQSDLLNKILQNENSEIKSLLDYSAKYRVRFNRNFLSKLLSLVIKQGTDRELVFRLREMIRSADV